MSVVLRNGLKHRDEKDATTFRQKHQSSLLFTKSAGIRIMTAKGEKIAKLRKELALFLSTIMIYARILSIDNGVDACGGKIANLALES